jgi:hypothetical protein
LFTQSETKPVDGILMSALRREGLDLLEQGKPLDAGNRVRSAKDFYLGALKDRGINFTQQYHLQPTMAPLKVWGEACVQLYTEKVRACRKEVIGEKEDLLEHVRRLLADVAETEAIITAYEEGVMEETRRKAREARAAAVG